MPGKLSLKYTLNIISIGDEPMLCAASISPLSTSYKALSICLVKKGTVPNTSGSIAPFVPIAVPTTILVKGISAASKITKGIDLNTFISLSIIL